MNTESSQGERLVATLMQLGFRPEGSFNASLVEFTKDVASMREVVRITLQFQKPNAQHAGLVIESAVVTRQQVVSLLDPGLPGAPDLIREDLIQLRRACSSWLAIQPQHQIKSKCHRCSKQAEDYFDLNDGRCFCLVCMEAVENEEKALAEKT